MTFILLWVCLGILYFLPTIIGYLRNIEHIEIVAIVNLFLGITFIVWLMALGYAIAAAPKMPSIPGPQEY